MKLGSIAETLRLAFRNGKVKAGTAVLFFLLLLAAAGPVLTPYQPLKYTGEPSLPLAPGTRSAPTCSATTSSRRPSTG